MFAVGQLLRLLPLYETQTIGVFVASSTGCERHLGSQVEDTGEKLVLWAAVPHC